MRLSKGTASNGGRVTPLDFTQSEGGAPLQLSCPPPQSSVRSCAVSPCSPPGLLPPSLSLQPLGSVVAVVSWFRTFSSCAKTLCTAVDPLPSTPTHANPILNSLFLVYLGERVWWGELGLSSFCPSIGIFLGLGTRFGWRPLVPSKLPFPWHGGVCLSSVRTVTLKGQSGLVFMLGSHTVQ